MLQNASVSGSSNMWKIEEWERNTTTEGGSSGSGLWDENHYLIGQLYGGQANCSNSINDYYGKFSKSWAGLSSWLDPQNTGATVLSGYDPNQSSDDGDFAYGHILHDFYVYPNPFSEHVAIEISSSISNNDINLSVLDISGRVIMELSNVSNKEKIIQV